MYIEGILERINLTDAISDDGFKVLDGTLGEWLEHHQPLFLNYFVSTANSKFLELIGKEYNVFRLENESDDDFKERILLEMNIVGNVDDLNKVGVRLWIYDENVLAGGEYLTSSNPSLKTDVAGEPVFLGHAENSIAEDYVDNKYVFNEEIIWF